MDGREQKLDIMKDSYGMSQITDVTTLHVDPSDDAAMPDILATANNVRAERATDMYEHSSRSHSIFTLHIDCVRGPEAHPFQMATSTECLVLQRCGEIIRICRKGRFRFEFQIATSTDVPLDVTLTIACSICSAALCSTGDIR